MASAHLIGVFVSMYTCALSPLYRENYIWLEHAEIPCNKRKNRDDSNPRTLSCKRGYSVLERRGRGVVTNVLFYLFFDSKYVNRETLWFLSLYARISQLPPHPLPPFKLVDLVDCAANSNDVGRCTLYRSLVCLVRLFTDRRHVAGIFAECDVMKERKKDTPLSNQHKLIPTVSFPDTSLMCNRKLPPSFWNSAYQPPPSASGSAHSNFPLSADSYFPSSIYGLHKNWPYYTSQAHTYGHQGPHAFSYSSMDSASRLNSHYNSLMMQTPSLGGRMDSRHAQYDLGKSSDAFTAAGYYSMGRFGSDIASTVGVDSGISGWLASRKCY